MRNLVQAFIAGIAGAVTVVVLIGATAIKTDGNVETDQQLVSNVQRGTPPLVVESPTVVPNLNADKIDDKDATAFASAASTYTMAEVDALLAASSAAINSVHDSCSVVIQDLTTGTSCSFDSVPPGKILVVEFFSGKVEFQSGQDGQVSLLVDTPGVGLIWHHELTKQFQYVNFDGRNQYHVSQLVRFYVDEGDALAAGLSRNTVGGPNEVFGTFYMTGYYVDKLP